MSTQRYRLSFLPLFEKDLDEITDYIANHLQNPDTSLRLTRISFSVQVNIAEKYDSHLDTVSVCESNPDMSVSRFFDAVHADTGHHKPAVCNTHIAFPTGLSFSASEALRRAIF